jgi:hypothetical protein
MNVIKLTLAAAALTIGIAASAAALPVAKLGAVEVDGIQADQVRLVCNRWGRCWHTGYRRHWRHHHWHHHRWHHRHWRHRHW